MELQEKKTAFEKNGLNVASVSYDSVEILKSFGDRVGITFPMLADPDSKIIRDFGILNESIQKGTPTYGIPYPGSYIVDAKGVVLSKYFAPDFRERYTAGNILLKKSPLVERPGWKELETQHLRLRYKASDEIVRAGNRVALMIQVSLKPKMHAYAPGVQGSYIPVQWQMATGAWKALDAQWPKSKTLHLKVINETLPVYKGKFVVSREVTLAQQKELMAAAGESKELTLGGTFRYQACDDKECYAPINVPLKWTLRVTEQETQRVPEALRRRK